MAKPTRTAPATFNETRPYAWPYGRPSILTPGDVQPTRRKMVFPSGGGAAVETLMMGIKDSIRFFDPFWAMPDDRLDRIAPAIKRDVASFEIVEVAS